MSKRHHMVIHSSVIWSLNQPESIHKNTQTSTSLCQKYSSAWGQATYMQLDDSKNHHHWTHLNTDWRNNYSPLGPRSWHMIMTQYCLCKSYMYVHKTTCTKWATPQLDPYPKSCMHTMWIKLWRCNALRFGLSTLCCPKNQTARSSVACFSLWA